VLRKAELHERLWPGTFVSDATLVGLIKQLRRALDDRDPTSRLIRTAFGVGYAFCQGFGACDAASIASFASRSAWALCARPTCSNVTRPISWARRRAFA
jgi:DNA-binding winged helix-turn-helix (wHTH) protein